MGATDDGSTFTTNGTSFRSIEINWRSSVQNDSMVDPIACGGYWRIPVQPYARPMVDSIKFYILILFQVIDWPLQRHMKIDRRRSTGCYIFFRSFVFRFYDYDCYWYSHGSWLFSHCIASLVEMMWECVRACVLVAYGGTFYRYNRLKFMGKRRTTWAIAWNRTKKKCANVGIVGVTKSYYYFFFSYPATY